jgi:hypothetical protein
MRNVTCLRCGSWRVIVTELGVDYDRGIRNECRACDFFWWTYEDGQAFTRDGGSLIFEVPAGCLLVFGRRKAEKVRHVKGQGLGCSRGL